MSGPAKRRDLQAASVSEPFAFRRRLRETDTRLDFIPVLDLIVIAMLLSLMFTRFVTLPGVRVDLPTTEMRMEQMQQNVAVLTVGNNGMLFFDGAVFEAGNIADGFEAYLEKLGKPGGVLLVKADFAMEMQEFLRVCELAREAGFIQVQLAGRPVERSGEPIPAVTPAEPAL